MPPNYWRLVMKDIGVGALWIVTFIIVFFIFIAIF